MDCGPDFEGYRALIYITFFEADTAIHLVILLIPRRRHQSTSEHTSFTAYRSIRSHTRPLFDTLSVKIGSAEKRPSFESTQSPYSSMSRRSPRSSVCSRRRLTLARDRFKGQIRQILAYARVEYLSFAYKE
jgi:hypothetical protein